MADCVSFFHMNRLYNLEIIGDLLLAFNGTDYQTAFNQTQFVRYLQYLLIEQGLGGLF